MHTYLFVGEDIEAQVESFIKEKAVQSFVFPVEKIAEARDLTSFTQYGFATDTIVVLPNFDKTTLDAQNSLLKLLEEGKPNTLFLLTARSTGAIVETILSRSEAKYFTKKDQQTSAFHTLSTGKKLALTAKVKDRESAKEFLLSLISQLPREKVKPALTAKEAIDRNGVVQLHLTQMVIQLEKEQ